MVDLHMKRINRLHDRGEASIVPLLFVYGVQDMNEQRRLASANKLVWHKLAIDYIPIYS